MEQPLNDLFEFLSGFGTQPISGIGLGGFLLLLLVSLASSLVIARFYLFFYANRATGSQVHRAFPLLSISITTIFVAIQFSLPLSLGLLGALSIVRFRTPIKEPEEIGFIMLVIASALSCATLRFGLLGILLLVSLVALLVQRAAARYLTGVPGGGLIVVSFSNDDDAAVTEDVINLLRATLVRGEVESLSRNPDSTVISYTFQAPSTNGLVDLQAELARRSPESIIDVFMNRTGVP